MVGYEQRSHRCERPNAHQKAFPPDRWTSPVPRQLCATHDMAVTDMRREFSGIVRGMTFLDTEDGTGDIHDGAMWVMEQAMVTAFGMLEDDGSERVFDETDDACTKWRYTRPVQTQPYVPPTAPQLGSAASPGGLFYDPFDPRAVDDTEPDDLPDDAG